MTASNIFSSDSNKRSAGRNEYPCGLGATAGASSVPIAELMRPEARQFLHDLIIGLPDPLFYELAAHRLNIPLKKSQTVILLGLTSFG